MYGHGIELGHMSNWLQIDCTCVAKGESENKELRWERSVSL